MATVPEYPIYRRTLGSTTPVLIDPSNSVLLGGSQAPVIRRRPVTAASYQESGLRTYSSSGAHITPSLVSGRSLYDAGSQSVLGGQQFVSVTEGDKYVSVSASQGAQARLAGSQYATVGSQGVLGSQSRQVAGGSQIVSVSEGDQYVSVTEGGQLLSGGAVQGAQSAVAASQYSVGSQSALARSQFVSGVGYSSKICFFLFSGGVLGTVLNMEVGNPWGVPGQGWWVPPGAVSSVLSTEHQTIFGVLLSLFC